MLDTLPDLLQPGLRIIFCGTAAGTASAARGAYYARPGNRFWRMLFKIGLTPRQLRPEEFHLLLTFGIGLTDVAKTASGADTDIPAHAFDRARLVTSLRDVRPERLAFNGKKAASLFLGIPTRQLSYGPIFPLPDFPPITVLPSTSGAANRFWSCEPWFAIAREVLCAASAAPAKSSDNPS